MTLVRPYKLPSPSAGLTIGIMGGSFDPPHTGHLHVIKTARERLGLDWVWAIPARGNPLKSTQTPFAARFGLTSSLLSAPRTRVTALEHDLDLTYTIDTLRTLKARAPLARFVWLMGADSLLTFDKWRGWNDIAELVPIAVISRPGAFPKAGLSRFAQHYRGARIPIHNARTLSRQAAPAWSLIKARHDPASSTALRAA